MTRTMASAMPPQPPQASLSFTRANGDMASFSSSFANPQQNYGQVMQQSHDFGTVTNSNVRGSFGEPRRQANSSQDKVIYTASYSGVPVYEMEVNGVAAMRRRADSWLNATQILKVAGIEKGRRTKILEKEIHSEEHEKVQGGYGRYQGTWISYHRGREFCRQYGVEDALRPLLDYDLNSDGTGNTAFADTPTKEQAMAANRKKFLNSSIESRVNGISRPTFFQNISPTASNALAAMNKAAKYETPTSRPGSAQKRPNTMLRRQSSHVLSQDSGYIGGSQQSMHSFTSEQPEEMFASQYSNMDDKEPPRKKLRASFIDPYVEGIQEETPTEPNESFSQQFGGELVQSSTALPPLPAPEDAVTDEKKRKLMDMLSDATRTDFSTHPAIMHLSSQDLDMPLDTKGNTALHWAALLGKIFVVRALVSKGANIYRGNAGGETALMHAVQVNNTHEQDCFAEMLAHLGPLIEVRDAIGRTVLHHIAVASGIKGRASSSRYYLEALLVFTVSGATRKDASKGKQMTLPRFMAEVVNIQDKSGNTALNLAARIGCRPIIEQLEEVGADFGIANHKGFRPDSFGIFPKKGTASNSSSQTQNQSQTMAQTQPSASHIDQIREEIFATTQTILNQTHTHYTTESNRLNTVLDTQSVSLRDLAAEHETLTTTLADLRTQSTTQMTLLKKQHNLRIVADKLRAMTAQRMQQQTPLSPSKRRFQTLDPNIITPPQSQSPTNPHPSPSLASFSPAYLRTLLAVNKSHNANLATKLARIEAATTDELGAQYRKVVALCTGVAEEDVDAVLPRLIGALEEEDGAAVGMLGSAGVNGIVSGAGQERARVKGHGQLRNQMPGQRLSQGQAQAQAQMVMQR